MRKLIVGAQVSMDGVMQAPGGPSEDPAKGFRFGGWTVPYRHPASGEELAHLFEERFDLLLGRKTYEAFAAFWPYQDEAAPQGLVDAMSLLTVPVVLGGGKKLFVDGAAPHAFRLVRSRVSPTGVMVGHYEREGEVKTGVSLPDAPSQRELARRERMKREG